MAYSSLLFQSVRSVLDKNKPENVHITPSPVAVEFHNLFPSDSCHHQRRNVAYYRAGDSKPAGSQTGFNHSI